ncbi:hypothetical protein Anapl_09825 [Anas platyrhynchos]|uniref:Uncharacterized protein n=1 Tax=Anas platyrhynchos TaxID=8839 RepID=R0LGX0_ANAPL|nr:hypothetical protein Anapl_09825 [Anas platyrhynchos]
MQTGTDNPNPGPNQASSQCIALQLEEKGLDRSSAVTNVYSFKMFPEDLTPPFLLPCLQGSTEGKVASAFGWHGDFQQHSIGIKRGAVTWGFVLAAQLWCCCTVWLHGFEQRCGKHDENRRKDQSPEKMEYRKQVSSSTQTPRPSQVSCRLPPCTSVGWHNFSVIFCWHFSLDKMEILHKMNQPQRNHQEQYLNMLVCELPVGLSQFFMLHLSSETPLTQGSGENLGSMKGLGHKLEDRRDCWDGQRSLSRQEGRYHGTAVPVEDDD